jgi:hypothetical protein
LNLATPPHTIVFIYYPTLYETTMTQTRELSPLVLPDHYLDSKLGNHSSVYTVTFSVNFGFMAGLADTYLGRSVLHIASIIVATGGFVAVSKIVCVRITRANYSA